MSRTIRTESESAPARTPREFSSIDEFAWARRERLILRGVLYFILLVGAAGALARPSLEERMRDLLVAAVALAGLACSVRLRD